MDESSEFRYLSLNRATPAAHQASANLAEFSFTHHDGGGDGWRIPVRQGPRVLLDFGLKLRLPLSMLVHLTGHPLHLSREFFLEGRERVVDHLWL